MIDAIDVVRAHELLEYANMITVSVAAGLALAGAAGSKDGTNNAISRYNRWMSGKQAIISNEVGFDVDEYGNTLLHSADDIRRWFDKTGNIQV